MGGAIPPLPNTPSWRGAHLKHRENFTFTFIKTSRSIRIHEKYIKEDTLGRMWAHNSSTQW
jgi:hypothetical protein